MTADSLFRLCNSTALAGWLLLVAVSYTHLSQFPSVTMIDWKNGKPNARYWVLSLLKDNFHAGDKPVSYTHLDVYKRQLLLSQPAGL